MYLVCFLIHFLLQYSLVKGVQRRMKRELLLIVERTSIRITQLYVKIKHSHTTWMYKRTCIRRAEEEGVSSNLRPSPTCENPRFLHSLLEMCFRQFEDVVSAHSILLEHLNATKKTYKGNWNLLLLIPFYSSSFSSIPFTSLLLLLSSTGTYELYLEADVWAGIQQIVSIYVCNYMYVHVHVCMRICTHYTTTYMYMYTQTLMM